jgi:hypothetical protein
MTEQQEHLKTCVEQQRQLITEIRDLEAQATQRRETATKLQGIIEYLTGQGVKLDDETPDAPPEETSAASIPTKDA